MINVVGNCVFMTPDIEVSSPIASSSTKFTDGLSHFYTFTDFIFYLESELSELENLLSRNYCGVVREFNACLSHDDIVYKIKELKIQIKELKNLRDKFLSFSDVGENK